MVRTLVFAAAILAASTASAEPIRYVLDPAHTQIGFTIDRFGFNHVLGRFEEISGEVILDEENPRNSSVRATIQVTGVDSGNDTRDEHLRGERWLNATAFPTIEFRSTSVNITGSNTAEVIGDLTMLGQTHPVTLDVTLNQIGEAPNNRRRTAGFSAAGQLSRSAWGSATAANLIGDQVVFTIEALAQVPQAE